MKTLLFIVSGLCVVLAGCSTTTDDPVAVYVRPTRGDIIDVHDFPSPDGRLVCTLFGEIFYDTTGYPRHVDLHRAGEKHGYPGNVCIVPVGNSVEVAWTSPSNLSVKLRFETRGVVPPCTNIMGVTVTFSELPRIRYNDNDSQTAPPAIIIPATSAK